MGLVAASLTIRTAIYAIGVLIWVDRPDADRLGAGLPGPGRGLRDRAGLGVLHPPVRLAPAGARGAVAAGAAPARAAGLRDPGLGRGHHLGRPAGRGDAKSLGGRRHLQRPAPDGGGVPDLRPDRPAGNLPGAGPFLADRPRLGPPGPGRLGPVPGAGDGAAGRRRDDARRAVGPTPASAGRLRGGEPPAGAGGLAGAAADPRLPLPVGADRGESGIGRGGAGWPPGPSFRRRWSRRSGWRSACRVPRPPSC